MKYAVVEIGGKQIHIKEGDSFEIERQSALMFNVLMFSDNEKVEIGEPFLKDIEVKAKIAEEKRAAKIRIGRFKSKSRYRRIKGHRQPISVVIIESINKKGAKVEKVAVETKVAEKPAGKKGKKVIAKKVPAKKVPAKKSTTKKATPKKSTSSAKKGAVKK